MSENRVVSKYEAVINGRVTGLAGCDGLSKGCVRTGCIRSNPVLDQGMIKTSVEDCAHFIPEGDE